MKIILHFLTFCNLSSSNIKKDIKQNKILLASLN